MARDTLLISRLALKLETRHLTALLLVHGVLAAALLAGMLVALAQLPAPADNAAESTTTVPSKEGAGTEAQAEQAPHGVALLDTLLAPERVPHVLTLGLASVAALALLGLGFAVSALRALPRAARLTEALQPRLPAALPVIPLADLLEASYRAERKRRALLIVTLAVLVTGLLTLATVVTWRVLDGGATATSVLAAMLLLFAALLFVAAPVLALAGWLGQRLRAAVARVAGKPLPSRRERARQRWRWLVLEGIYRFDLESEPFKRAAKPAAVRWLNEASEIAVELHDCLQATLREAGKNKLKGVGQGPFEKFAKKIGAEHVFDPSRHRFSQFDPGDVRLKIESDATTYRLTLKSSIGEALPGEIIVHSDLRVELPRWTHVEPLVERLSLAALSEQGES